MNLPEGWKKTGSEYRSEDGWVIRPSRHVFGARFEVVRHDGGSFFFAGSPSVIETVIFRSTLKGSWWLFGKNPAGNDWLVVKS